MQPPLTFATVPCGHEDLSSRLHLVLSPSSRKPESQALHMDAPLLVQSEPDLGVPLSHLQLFFSHFVWSSFSRKPESQALHMEAPLLVHSDPDLGVPFSHLQRFFSHFVWSSFSRKPESHLVFSHLVLSELSRKLESQPLHMEAPLLVQSEPDLGVPLSHLQV